MFNTNTPSVADIAAVTNGGFGNNDWWPLIILLGLFGGFDRNRQNCCCDAATSADIQRGFDNQSVLNKLNGIEQGICSLGYDQLGQMNNLGTTIMQTGFGLQRDIQNASVANMQDTNSLSRQMSDCCCDIRQLIMMLGNNNDKGFCEMGHMIQDMGREIIQNDNNNYRAIHDELVRMQMDAKDQKIADQASTIQALNFAVSQRNQNDYLVSQLKPCPIPAYVVPNPNCCTTSTGNTGNQQSFNM